MADLAGLLGIDPELMKLLTGGAQTDSKAPLNAGLMAAGLGMLANSHKGLAGGIGEGGLLGMQAFQAEKQRQQKDPAQAIGMANALLGLQQGMAKNQWMKDFANQAGQGPDGQAGQGMAIAGPPTASVQQQQPAAGGSMPLTRIIQGMMLGMPGADKLYDKSTAAPVFGSGGQTPMSLNALTGQWSKGDAIPNLDKGMEMGPGGVRAVPNYPQVAAEIAGAQTGAMEDAKAARSIISRPNSDNTTTNVLQSQEIARLNGTRQQDPQPPAGVLAAMDELKRRGVPTRWTLAGGLEVGDAATQPPVIPGQTRSPEATDLAKQQALAPGALAQATQQDISKADAARVDAMITKGQAAAEANVTLQKARELSTGANAARGGMMAPTLQSVDSFFNGIGIPFNAGQFRNTQELQTYLSGLSMAQVKQMVGSSAISDRDVAAVKSMMPQIVNDPKVRLRLLDTLEKANDKHIDMAVRADQHLRENLSLKGFDYGMKQPAAKPEQPSRSAAVMQIEAEMRRRGLIK